VVVKTGQLAVLDIPVDEKRLSSTFYNYNSFATYAGTCLVAACGLTLSLYREEIVRGSGWRLRLSSFIDATGHRGAILIAGCFIILVALLMTGSRGGVVSTGIGLAVLGALNLWQGRKHGEALNGTLLFGTFLAAATLIVFGSTLADRIDTSGVSDPNRLLVYRLTLQSILDKPLLGFGYGTFPVIFPMYRDRSLSVDGVWVQAHDTYLEVLQGLGVVFGAALIAAVVILVIYALKGSLRRRENAIVPQVSVGAACLVGLHSFVDFSLQIQAVALTFIALLGAGVAQAASSRRSLAD
jgi:O-antigen ligase